MAGDAGHTRVISGQRKRCCIMVECRRLPDDGTMARSADMAELVRRVIRSGGSLKVALMATVA
jgi:hypothetical protein